MLDGRDALEHLGEVSHDVGDVLRVTDDLKQVFVTHEIEPGKVLSLLLQILTESLLDVF